MSDRKRGSTACLAAAIMAATLSLLVQAHAAAPALDPNFNSSGGPSGWLEHVVPLPDGKILISGSLISYGSQRAPYITRLNEDGTPDSAFQNDVVKGWVRHMSVQSDGKIIVGGHFYQVGNAPRNLIARLHPNGALDPSFNPGSGFYEKLVPPDPYDPFVFWHALQSDGKVIVGGSFAKFNGQSARGIARLNTDGSLDSTFKIGSGFDSFVRFVSVLPNGQIIAAGWFTSYNGFSCNRIVLLNPDGTVDPTFRPFFGDMTAIYAAVQLPNGQFIVSGHTRNPQGLFDRKIARLNRDGTEDTAFVAKTNERTESLLLQPDGKIIASGWFTFANNETRSGLVRFNADGTLDPSFVFNVSGGHGFIWTTGLDRNGNLLLAGSFAAINGQPRNHLARIANVVPVSQPPLDTPPALSIGNPTQGSLRLTWSDSGNSRTGYLIEQRSGGNYLQVGSVPATAREFTVNGLAAGTQYHFRLRANNSSGTFVFSNEASGTTSTAAVSSGNSASFVRIDAATQGTWKGTYGAEGRVIIGEGASLPSYAAVTPSGKYDWTWQDSTHALPAVQRANGTDRFAACWYSAGEFSVALTFTDGQTHRVTAYFLDWDRFNRQQIVSVIDADTGAVFDTRSISSFTQGLHLTWDLRGRVVIKITSQAVNGVLSALFIDPPSGSTPAPAPTLAAPTISPAGGTFSSPQQVTLAAATTGSQIRYTLNGAEPTASSTLYAGPFALNASGTVKAKAFKSGYNDSATATAVFSIVPPTGAPNRVAYAGADSATRGSWRGVYGSEGHIIYGKAAATPAYVQISSTKGEWVWNDPATDLRALQYPENANARLASCWYGDTVTITFDFTDGRTHRFAGYFCDWDNNGRAQKIEILDASTGAVLWSETLSSFAGGQYRIWDMKGRLKMRLTKLSGHNAVVNGLFFQPAPAEI